jgi:hypothetical protein
VVGVGDRLQAANAWSMGNLGLATALRDGRADGGYDVEDEGEPVPVAGGWARLGRRVARWALAAGVAVAYAHHWPGGR